MGMLAILVMWPEQFISILANLSQVDFIWNLSSIGLMVSEKTMFYYIDGTPIWETFAERPTSTFRTYLWSLSH